jgi:hypothetical protein
VKPERTEVEVCSHIRQDVSTQVVSRLINEEKVRILLNAVSELEYPKPGNQSQVVGSSLDS